MGVGGGQREGGRGVKERREKGKEGGEGVEEHN